MFIMLVCVYLEVLFLVRWKDEENKTEHNQHWIRVGLYMHTSEIQIYPSGIMVMVYMKY